MSQNISINRELVWPWFECFPGTSVVTIKSHNKLMNISISELKINDMVLTSAENSVPQYAKVVSFFHRIQDIDAKFIRLYYHETKFITLTPKHLIYSQKEYIPAQDVKVGNSLKVFDHFNKTIIKVTVIKKTEISLGNSGIYAPLTESGTIIVDNVHASCYSVVKSHNLAQAFFNAVNKLGSILTIKPKVYESISKILFDTLEYLNLTSFVLNSG